MEPHKNQLVITDKPLLEDGPIVYFQKARKFAEQNYQEEINKISSVIFEDVTPTQFFCEYIWVVHATGFSAKAVGKFFHRLLQSYGTYVNLSSSEFSSQFEEIKKVCNNAQKAKAVYTMAKMMSEGIDKTGWKKFKTQHLSSPEKLQTLPYVGKITCFHLARNLGLLDCVKPDLHLVRMAEYWEFPDCVAMCKAMQPKGMPLGIVDLILWYGASTFGTIAIKKDGKR